MDSPAFCRSMDIYNARDCYQSIPLSKHPSYSNLYFVLFFFSCYALDFTNCGASISTCQAPTDVSTLQYLLLLSFVATVPLTLGSISFFLSSSYQNRTIPTLC
ncbi:MAG: hypothetical protein BYD32DRAFT_153520 [Podila humilis]|nr:MAG: hypothetical protein BYD32DRAFT_153520 [Podila humilis]